MFSVGGTSLLDVLTSATLESNNATDEGATATSKANSPQLVKKSATLTFDLVANSSGGGARATNLDVSALTIGGTAYVASLQNATLSIGYVSDSDVSGEADKWAFPQNIRLGDVTIDGTLKIEASAAPGIIAIGLSATLTDAVADVTLTVNGVPYTMPMIIEKVGHMVKRDNVQECQVTLKLRDDGYTNIPNAPTGTTSIIEKALNAYTTALALSWTTKASGGLTYSGNFIFNSVTLTTSNSSVISLAVTMSSQGTITAAPTP